MDTFKSDILQVQVGRLYVLFKTLNSSVVVLSNDVKLMWRHQGSDIESVAAICVATADFPFWSYPTCCVASLHAGPVGCISYNNVIVDAPLVTLGVSGVWNDEM